MTWRKTLSLSAFVAVSLFLKGQPNTWTAEETPFDNNVSQVAAFSLGEYGYAALGYNTSTSIFLDQVWRFDPTTEIWTRMGDFPGGRRSNSAVFTINGKAYVGGGYVYEPNNNLVAEYNDLWEYTPESDTWIKKASFPGVSYFFTSFSLGGKGYFIGANFGAEEQVWEYDPIANTWTRKNDHSPGANAMATFIIGEKVYVAGGQRGSTILKELWEYTPSTDSWIRKKDLPVATRGAFGFSLAGRGFISGGFTQTSNATPAVYEYNSVTNIWTPKASLSSGSNSPSGFSLNCKAYVGFGFTGTPFSKYTPDQPFVQIASHDLICKGDTASLVSSGALVYSWAPSEFLLTPDNSVTKAFPKSTTTFTVTGTDEFGCSASSSITLSVSTPIAISDNEGIHFEDTAEICTESSINLLTQGAVTTIWKSAEGVEIGSQNILNVTPDVNTFFSVQTHDIHGCESKDTVWFNVIERPISAFEFLDSGCHGDTATFSYSGPYQEDVFRSWSVDGGEVLQEGDGYLAVRWTQLGTAHIELSASNNVCTTSSSAEPFIKPIPGNGFSMAPLLCGADTTTVYYDGSAGENAVFNWDFGTGEVISEEEFRTYKTKWSTLGAKTISLFVTENGCVSETNYQEIQIIERPISIFESLDSGCDDAIATFTYSGPSQENVSLSWSIDGGQILQNNGDGNLIVQWTDSGLFHVSLSASNDACTTTFSTEQEVKPIPDNSFSVAPLLCGSDTATISYTGNAGVNAIYSWDFGGGEIISETAIESYQVKWSSFDSHSISLFVTDNGCTSTTNLSVVAHYPYPEKTFSALDKICHNSEYQIAFTGTNATSIEWNLDDATIVSGDGWNQPYLLTWPESGTKNINVILENNGCQSDTTIHVMVTPNPSIPEICMVSIGENSSKNEIHWTYQLSSIQSFGIYKETREEDVFELIAYIDGNQTQFVDQASLPEQNSNRYKLSVVDTCGFETPLSGYHKTIHLTIGRGVGNAWNLNWNLYEGLDYSGYRIYRGKTNEDMVILAELPANLQSFTDVSAPPDNVFYQIELLGPGDWCSNTQNGRSKDTRTIRSNKAYNLVTSVENIIATSNIYPNPSAGLFNIELDNEFKNGVFMVFDYHGNQLKSETLTDNNFSVDLTDFPPGVYCLQISSLKHSRVLKLIKL